MWLMWIASAYTMDKTKSNVSSELWQGNTRMTFKIFSVQGLVT